MRKTIIILVVTVIAVGVFLSPILTERTHSVDFSSPNKIVKVNQEPIALTDPVEIPLQNFENMVFEKVFIQNSTSKMILYGYRTEKIGVITPKEISNKVIGKWYQATISAGYFQQIDKVNIYSPRQILFDVGGNLGTTLFWGLLSLGLGLIFILVTSILNVPNVPYKKKLTAAY